MVAKQYPQYSFKTGEVSSDHVWRLDLKLRDTSLQKALNVELTVAGSAVGRRGSYRSDSALGDGWLVAMPVVGNNYFLCVTATNVRVYDQSTRAMIAEVTGCAWTSGMLPDLVIEAYGNQAFFFHQTMPTQILTQSKLDGTWSVAPLTFIGGIGGSVQQPFYRFADPGVTIQPSALTGSITLVTSANYFDVLHVGLRLRLQGREVLITSVSDSTHAAATVIQSLFPTMTVQVDTSAGFDIGEVIQGTTSTAKGEVIAKPDATHLTVLMSTFTNFSFLGSGKGETLVGANTTAQVAATPAAASSLASVLDWSEQIVSALRGYPGTGTVHANRLWIARFPLLPFGLGASAINDFGNFGIGTANNDALFEILGDAGAGVIQHIFSGEQLLIMTKRRLYYCPESETNPITPTSFSVLRVGPDGSNTCKPVLISEGALYCDVSGGSVLGAFQTGDVRRSWRTANMSYLAGELIVQPRQMAYLSGSPTDTVRYAIAANLDGTIAMLAYDESDDDAVPGWVGWNTAGIYRSVAALNGECWSLVGRVLDGVTTYEIEVMDPTRLMDCTFDIGMGAYVGPGTGQVIITPSGVMAADSVYQCAAFHTTPASLVIGGAYIGDVVLDDSGNFGVPNISGAIELGLRFASQCIPWPPLDAEDVNFKRRKKRIARADIRYRGRYMTVNNMTRPSYDGGEDTTVAPPVRDELFRVSCFGWDYEPTFTISKPWPAPWLLLGYSMEVSG